MYEAGKKVNKVTNREGVIAMNESTANKVRGLIGAGVFSSLMYLFANSANNTDFSPDFLKPVDDESYKKIVCENNKDSVGRKALDAYGIDCPP